MKPSFTIGLCFVVFFLPHSLPAAAENKKKASNTVDFARDIKPILESACISCHGPDDQKGDVRLDSLVALKEEGDSGPILTPGDAEDSSIYWTTDLPEDDDLVMPPKKADRLSEKQQELLKTWVNEGGHWPKSIAQLEEVPRMRFDVNIKPLLVKGGPFDEQELYQLRLWVEQGAEWPKGESLGGEEPIAAKDDPELDLVNQIREKILADTTVTSEDQMEEYTAAIPDYPNVEYTMVPIKGGTFQMGSPDSESDRNDDEGPQVGVEIKPFWMGKHEVTWDEYIKFMLPELPRNKDGSLATPKEDATIVELVARPTEPYQEMSFGMGQDGYPAICMTQHAANKYCEWLSAQTGHFYRLPTEAEWEYACRAGTNTAYSFGDDPSDLDDYAWYFANSDFQYQQVGQKKPNPWGLHDMHGNVIEWTLDQYAADQYASLGDDSNATPWLKSSTPYPHVARGGSWDDDPQDLRSAARRQSHENWKQQDPQLPKSIWYHTDAVWLGFRIVRPLEVPSAEEMKAYWYNGVEND
ncbi:MAG: SUMF1/EgtB/PvdO family nonheme iron enzyme [Verrucomicrobiota bacterium]